MTWVRGFAANPKPAGLYEKTGSADTDWSRLVPIPAGGTTGQVLTKASDADYDFVWS